jgi:hypothetical protein
MDQSRMYNNLIKALRATPYYISLGHFMHCEKHAPVEDLDRQNWKMLEIGYLWKNLLQS